MPFLSEGARWAVFGWVEVCEVSWGGKGPGWSGRVGPVRVEAASKTPCGLAPGFRSLASGGLSYVGNGGFSYSSSVSGSNGVYLDFYVTGLNPSYAYLRAYGLQLRCLLE